jgi:hypothetical protein
MHPLFPLLGGNTGRSSREKLVAWRRTAAFTAVEFAPHAGRKSGRRGMIGIRRGSGTDRGMVRNPRLRQFHYSVSFPLEPKQFIERMFP